MISEYDRKAYSEINMKNNLLQKDLSPSLVYHFWKARPFNFTKLYNKNTLNLIQQVLNIARHNILASVLVPDRIFLIALYSILFTI